MRENGGLVRDAVTHWLPCGTTAEETGIFVLDRSRWKWKGEKVTLGGLETSLEMTSSPPS